MHRKILVVVSENVDAIFLKLDVWLVPPVAIKSVQVTTLVQEEQRFVFPESSLIKPRLFFVISPSEIGHLHDSVGVRELPVERIKFEL